LGERSLAWSGGVLLRRGKATYPGGVDRETGEPLAEIVVELSGETSPLVLVRGKKATRERPGLFLGDPAPGTLPK
jgi:hypothetical protein